MRDPERYDEHRVPPVRRLDHQLYGQRGSQSGREQRRRGGQKVGGGEQRGVPADHGEAGPARKRRQRAHQRSACVCDALVVKVWSQWTDWLSNCLNLTHITHLAASLMDRYEFISRTANICSPSATVLFDWWWMCCSDKPLSHQVYAWYHTFGSLGSKP